VVVVVGSPSPSKGCVRRVYNGSPGFFAVIVDRQPNQELRFTDDIGLCRGLSLFHRFAGFGLASSHELTALALE
jgi:hypothetical protein